uniref:Potassium channel domain-containing protein n=1 Tax=Kalanchoe fedtschenkoi TaxID=63787 RepID=A0A7N0RC36_KALFE
MGHVNGDKPPEVPAAVAGLDLQPLTSRKAPPKRRYRRCRSAPVQPADEGSQTSRPGNILKHLQPSFRIVAIFLAVYLGVGTLCFSVVGHHIKGKKTNAVLDAVYLSVVTMTTVGYGDLVPDSVFTKLMACAYVFLGMALVGLLLANAADYLVERQEMLLAKALLDVTEEGETKKVKYKCVTVVVILSVLVAVGISVLMWVENLSFVDAFYCACCTVSTLGYGDVSFTTTIGRIFAVFWIPAGTLCAAQFYLYIAELATEKKRKSLVKWVLTRKMTKLDLEAADFDGDGAVDAAEFVIFKMKELGKITSRDVELCLEEFEHLDVDQTGTLSTLDINLADLVIPQN